jgi:hypothetical protein
LHECFAGVAVPELAGAGATVLAGALAGGVDSAHPVAPIKIPPTAAVIIEFVRFMVILSVW